MRRSASLLVAAVLLTGCTVTAPPEPPPKAPPQPTGITQTINAEVRLDPDLKVVSTEFPVVIGTFSDEEHGWMVADYTRLLATTDGGRHWSHAATFDDNVRRLNFISETRGWAFTDKGTLATTDGGHTWQPAAMDRLPVRGQFRDEQFGWDIEQKNGSSPSFLRLTQDGGQTWTTQPTPCKPGFQAGAASFVSPESGWLLCGYFQGSGGMSKWLYRTIDGGQHWQLLTGTIYGQAHPDFPPGVKVGASQAMTTPPGALPPDYGGATLVFLDEAHGLFSLSRGPFTGHTYTSTDGGKTWTPLAVPPGDFTGGFRFFTPSFGRILVNNQQQWAWLETHDGGATWEQLYPPLAPLLVGTPTLQFLDADHGVAAHTLLDPDATLSTADGGRTWQVVPQESGASSAPPSSRATWQPQSLPGKAVSSSLHPGGCGWVIVVGDPPKLELSLLVTQDDGHTWTLIQTPGIVPVTVTSVDCTCAWLTDSRGHLYRTMDGGHRWDQML